jgi:hypothetical protein
MSKGPKYLEQMRNNPRDWRIDQVETVAGEFGIVMRQPGTSHVTISHPQVDWHFTIPVKRPIKPWYITQLVKFVDELQASNSTSGEVQ